MLFRSRQLIQSIGVFAKKFSKSLNKEYFRVRKMEGDFNVRTNPIVTKLETPEFKSIFTKEINDLVDLFNKYGYEIRIAGGAVRDLLLNKVPKDIDFATTATPDQMKEMFTNENIRMINMKGEKHGTITPRINDKENFEITTLRIDTATDGRHAEVKFTTDWLMDANRRDLTINSMFLGFDGSVYDYFFGYEDLQKRRVAFVGNPDTRIKEDFLRILRYFRFYGRIALKPDGHEETTLQTIKNNATGLQRISGERIWSELRQIIDGNFSYDIVFTMLDCDLGKYIGLPEIPNRDEYKFVYENSKKFKDKLYAISLLSALLHTPEDGVALHERLKLSAYERDLCYYLTQYRKELLDVDDLLEYKKMCMKSYARKEYVEEILKYNGKVELYNELRAWTAPRFEINGHIVRQHGCSNGKAIGTVLGKLKDIWAESNFKISSEELLVKHLPEILIEIPDSQNGGHKKKLKTEK